MTKTFCDFCGTIAQTGTLGGIRIAVVGKPKGYSERTDFTKSMDICDVCLTEITNHSFSLAPAHASKMIDLVAQM